MRDGLSIFAQPLEKEEVKVVQKKAVRESHLLHLDAFKESLYAYAKVILFLCAQLNKLRKLR